MRTIVTHAKQLRKNSTDAERFLWRELRSRQIGGYKFRRQQALGPFIVDFVCLERRLVVELDGGQHAQPEQMMYDSDPSQRLVQQGFCVLRFWDHEVLKQVDGVKETIAKALGEKQS